MRQEHKIGEEFTDNRVKEVFDGLKEAIHIPNYGFEEIKFYPRIKKIGVTIFVKSEIYAILQSCKPTIREVGKELNEQYERHLNTEPEQVELKSLVSIPFKCPNMEDSCPFVDTMTATLDMNCSECEHNIKANK